jgi:MHS family proline/betaine transporter-like MFS transporter
MLIAIRLFQGFSVGGEFVGSVTYLVENASQHRRGIAGSVANLGATVGMLLAAGAGAFSETHAVTFRHLWRLPFLVGGVLAFVGYQLRRHLPPEETPAQATPQEKMDDAGSGESTFAKLIARWPALQAFREIPRTMVVSILFTCGYGVSNYITMVFLPTFAHEFAGIGDNVALKINSAGQAVAFFVVPLAGWISDRWIRRRTMLAAAFLLQALLGWMLFGLIMKGGVDGLWAAQLLLAGLLALVMGTAPAMLAEQFPRGFRVSGHALVLNVGIGVAGGSAPMISVALIKATGSHMAPAAYLAVACLISCVSAALLADRSREQL